MLYDAVVIIFVEKKTAIGNNEFIESPALIFLLGKVDVVKNDDVVSIASSFYTEDEKKTAKQTFYWAMNCEAEFVDRRGGDAAKISITYMLRKLITAPPLTGKILRQKHQAITASCPRLCRHDMTTYCAGC